MNRPPGKTDTWWAKHEAECGGAYLKIQEPAPTKKQLVAMSGKERAGRQKNKLDSWLRHGPKTVSSTEGRTSDRPLDLSDDVEAMRCSNRKRKVSTLVVGDVVMDDDSLAGQKRPRTGAQDDILNTHEQVMIECPICEQKLAESKINDHLDVVHIA